MHPFYGKSKHPFTIGLWKGIDGSSIMLAHGYDYGRRWNDEDLSENEQLKELAGRTPLNTVYRYYGTGDIRRITDTGLWSAQWKKDFAETVR